MNLLKTKQRQQRGSGRRDAFRTDVSRRTTTTTPLTLTDNREDECPRLMMTHSSSRACLRNPLSFPLFAGRDHVKDFARGDAQVYVGGTQHDERQGKLALGFNQVALRLVQTHQ